MVEPGFWRLRQMLGAGERFRSLEECRLAVAGRRWCRPQQGTGYGWYLARGHRIHRRTRSGRLCLARDCLFSNRHHGGIPPTTCTLSAQPHHSPAPVTVGTTYFGFLSSNGPMTGDCARSGRYGHAGQRPRHDLLPAATWLIGAAAGRSDSRQYGPATRLVGRQPLRATVRRPDNYLLRDPMPSDPSSADGTAEASGTSTAAPASAASGGSGGSSRKSALGA